MTPRPLTTPSPGFPAYDAFGTHRVLEPRGALPQEAHRLDARPEIAPNELLIAVDRLNLDAASFLQLRAECGDDPAAIGRRVAAMVAERGKMQNPVTGSGGVLCGTLVAMGAEHPRATEFAAILNAGDGPRVATLISLTLTPLRLEQVGTVDLAGGQIEVRGTAVLFAGSAFAVLPPDLPEPLALAVLDVAGAPAHTRRLAKRGDTVFILGGGGRAGLLCQEAAARSVGSSGRVIAWCHPAEAAERARRLAAAAAASDPAEGGAPSSRAPVTVLHGDATDALGTLRAVTAATNGGLADLTINCVSAPGTEMASILATRDGGTVLFFGMATDFTRAALGAEGVGKDITMLIGNGYAQGHAEAALELVRSSAALRDLFSGR
ncbi:MAG: L-erythro-3,5-diaminohexanoate dehydrogenase [Thermoleophilia bacterium]